MGRYETWCLPKVFILFSKAREIVTKEKKKQNKNEAALSKRKQFVENVVTCSRGTEKKINGHVGWTKEMTPCTAFCFFLLTLKSVKNSLRLTIV